MFKALKVSREKLREKGIGPPKRHVRSIRGDFGKPIDMHALKNLNGF